MFHNDLRFVRRLTVSTESYFLSFLIVLATCLLTTPAAAQHALQGRVVVGPDQKPAPGAYIYIVDLNKGTLAGSEGGFSFSDLPSSPLTLEISYVGYETRVRTLHPGKAEQPVTVHLPKTTLRVPPLTVTGDRPRSRRSAPMNIEVVDQARLLEEGESSLWAALEESPGVWLQTNGPGVERPVIRGVSSDRIQILNRGVEYHYQTWDPESGLSISGNNTERVEVIRGPATLRYGGGAMGGVIALEPDRPAPVGKMLGTYRVGLFSNTRGINNALSLKGARKGYFWGVNAGYQAHADYSAGGGEVIPNTRYNHLQLQANGGLTRDWGTTRLSYEYLRRQNGIVEAEEEESEGESGESGSVYSIHPPYHNLEHHALVSETNWYRGDAQLNLTLGLQHNIQQEFEPEEEGESIGRPSMEEMEEGAALELVRDAIDYRAEWIQSLEPDIKLTAGIEGDVQQNTSEGREHFVPNADIINAGAFGILSWDATRPLTLRGGLRYDFSSIETSKPASEGEFERKFDVPMDVERTFHVLNGSAGLSFHPDDQWTVKARAATGYRTPNLAELTADGLLREVKRYKVGDPDLDAEYNIETDLSTHYRQNQFTIQVSGYVNLVENYIFQQRTGEIAIGDPGSPIPAPVYALFHYRQADARIRGFEGSVDLHPTGLPWIRLQTRFSLTRGTLISGGTPLPMIPGPRWTNTLRFTRRNVGPLNQLNLEIRLQKTFTDDRTPDYEPQTNGYLLTDVHLTGEIPWENRKLRLNLTARNLFDVEYTSALSRLKYQEIPNRGRTVTLTVKVPFKL